MYGIAGMRPTHCKSHALSGMINVKEKRICANCSTRGSYQCDGKWYCVKHKPTGAVRKRPDGCLTCGKRACFGLPGTKKPIYCIDHKEADHVDVVHKLCQYNDCAIRATYGKPLCNPTRCFEHKEAGMLCPPSRRCIVEDCKELAQYGEKDPRHCDEHKTCDEINLVERQCANCQRIDVLGPDDLCVNFCQPERVMQLYKKRAKVKETRVAEVLSTDFEPPHRYNKQLIGIIPSESRPDFLYQFAHESIRTTIIVEVDENQHRDRCFEREQGRMIEMASVLEGATIFIRYNPDEYTPVKGSPLSTEKRERALIKLLHELRDNPPDAPGGYIYYLFYDEFDPDESIFFLPTNQCRKNCCDQTYLIPQLYRRHRRKHHASVIRTSSASSWQGGKPGGNITKRGRRWAVSFLGNTAHSRSFDSEDDAKKYQREKSLQLGLTKNMYRFIVDGNDPYIEVQLQDGFVMQCDLTDLGLVQQRVWNHNTNSKRQVVRCSASKKHGYQSALFHSLVMPNCSEIIHIDGNGLNNRRSNLMPKR